LTRIAAADIVTLEAKHPGEEAFTTDAAGTREPGKQVLLDARRMMSSSRLPDRKSVD